MNYRHIAVLALAAGFPPAAFAQIRIGHPSVPVAPVTSAVAAAARAAPGLALDAAVTRPPASAVAANLRLAPVAGLLAAARGAVAPPLPMRAGPYGGGESARQLASPAAGRLASAGRQYPTRPVLGALEAAAGVVALGDRSASPMGVLDGLRRAFDTGAPAAAEPVEPAPSRSRGSESWGDWRRKRELENFLVSRGFRNPQVHLYADVPEGTTLVPNILSVEVDMPTRWEGPISRVIIRKLHVGQLHRALVEVGGRRRFKWMADYTREFRVGGADTYRNGIPHRGRALYPGAARETLVALRAIPGAVLTAYRRPNGVPFPGALAVRYVAAGDELRLASSEGSGWVLYRRGGPILRLPTSADGPSPRNFYLLWHDGAPSGLRP